MVEAALFFLIQQGDLVAFGGRFQQRQGEVELVDHLEQAAVLLFWRGVVAQGTAPSTVGFITEPGSKEFAPEVTGWMTLIPTIYNADTLGIRPDLIKRPIDTWAELLNPEFKGKASI